MMDCPMCGMMGIGMVLAMLLGLALLVLVILGIFRMWPKKPVTFASSEPVDDDRPAHMPDDRSGPS